MGNLKFRISRPDQFEKYLIIYKLKLIFDITLYFQVRHKVSHLINFKEIKFSILIFKGF